MSAAVRAGLVYFGIAFAAGFVLGVFRSLLLAPWLGEVEAVALEVPIMLAISWTACRVVVERYELDSSFAERALMGAVAFGMLMASEWLLSLALGLPMLRKGAMLGLLGQMLFGTFPVLQAMWPVRTVRSKRY